jgi:hypothetical protein
MTLARECWAESGGNSPSLDIIFYMFFMVFGKEIGRFSTEIGDYGIENHCRRHVVTTSKTSSVSFASQIPQKVNPRYWHLSVRVFCLDRKIVFFGICPVILM